MKTNNFPNAEAVSTYAEEAMRWAIGNGILQGMGDGTLQPQAELTRAQTAALLAWLTAE